MSTRPIVFVGGKGGVGKTTVATALARALAASGHRTLLVSTDPAHSTGDLLEARLGDEPVRIAEQLDAVEIDAERVAVTYVEAVRRDLHRVVAREVRPTVDRHLDLAREGAGTLDSALLDRLTDLIALQPTTYDRIVIDTAPTGHMLRLLAMPDVLERWIQGLVRQREGVQGMDRMLANMVGDEPARDDDPVLDRLRRQRERLGALRHRLEHDALLHAVMIPERLPIEETARALPALRAAGVHVGCVVVNRVLPESADGEFLAARRRQQDAYLREIRERLAGEQLVIVPQQPEDVSTAAALAELSAHLAPLLGDTVDGPEVARPTTAHDGHDRRVMRMSDEVTIKVTKNGPLTVKGPVRLEGADGEPWTDIPEGTNVALCRCGLSAVKPYCDGSHNKGGFDSAPTAAEQPYPW